eukprot:TRINITY_DN9684_c0_g1_i1.p1 TRINITY_DN9684_c0_g1~~TRINITY_DN9684_c0_g1_i1.p1  ORF type:complete len:292 (-),score=65.09 TRINITY_DN9684_c0_g1_i1:96-971(-)
MLWFSSTVCFGVSFCFVGWQIFALVILMLAVSGFCAVEYHRVCAFPAGEARVSLRKHLFVLMGLSTFLRSIFFILIATLNNEDAVHLLRVNSIINGVCDLLCSAVDLLLMSYWVTVFVPGTTARRRARSARVWATAAMFAGLVGVAGFQIATDTRTMDASYTYVACVLLSLSIIHFMFGVYLNVTVARTATHERLPLGIMWLLRVSMVCSLCYAARALFLGAFALNYVWADKLLTHPWFAFCIYCALLVAVPQLTMLYVFRTKLMVHADAQRGYGSINSSDYPTRLSDLST